MTLFEKTKQRMAELGIQPKKTLGQNFLISDHVVNKIAQAAKSLNPQQIIEVGPGLGALTDLLQEVCPNIFLIELDKNFAQYWRAKGLHVTEEDALRVSFEKLIQKKPVVFVSNLPYQISSGIVIERCLDADRVDAMVLMFQKEVAQKIKARISEDYGMLSIFSQTFWDIELLLEAGTQDFFPPPKVASRVLVFKKKPDVSIPAKEFLRLLKAAFQQPRKKMINNIEHGLHLPKNQLQEVFSKLQISENARGEELSVAKFHELFFTLKELMVPGHGHPHRS